MAFPKIHWILLYTGIGTQFQSQAIIVPYLVSEILGIQLHSVLESVRNFAELVNSCSKNIFFTISFVVILDLRRKRGRPTNRDQLRLPSFSLKNSLMLYYNITL